MRGHGRKLVAIQTEAHACQEQSLAVCRAGSVSATLSALQGHGPFGQFAQLDAIVHEGVRDVAALLAVRQLAGNATGAVAVERSADELLVRVETLPPQVKNLCFLDKGG
jgi:hypothetical protein